MDEFGRVDGRALVHERHEVRRVIFVRMNKLLWIALSSMLLASTGCKKDEPVEVETPAERAAPMEGQAPPQSATTRDVAITVTASGYEPARIEAAPGESLNLVFTRTAESECAEYVKVAGGEKHELPLNEAVSIPVSVPESGEITFACGMDMMTGVVVAKSHG